MKRGIKYGVLGGTFNPAHMGHLNLAERSISAFGLDTVYFVPANVPPHKAGRNITPFADRARFVRVAISGNPRLKLLTIEAERHGKSYTVDTLALMLEKFGPGLHFIMGMDMFADISNWHKPLDILAMCDIIVALRPGQETDPARIARSATALFRKRGYRVRFEQYRGTRLPAGVSAIRMGGNARNIYLCRFPMMDISSTDIREKLYRGESVRYLIPERAARLCRAIRFEPAKPVSGNRKKK